MKETEKVSLLIRRHTAPLLRLLTSASLVLEGSEDRKRVREERPGLKVALLWYPGFRVDVSEGRLAKNV